MAFLSYFVTGLLLVMAAPPGVQSYNILMSTLVSRSHKIVFEAIAEELGKRGHQVTILCGVSSTVNFTGVTEVIIPEVEDIFQSAALEGVFDEGITKSKLLVTTFKSVSKTSAALEEMFNKFVNSDLVSEILEKPFDANGKPKFDVVITDAGKADPSLPLAYVMRVPAVYLSPLYLTPQLAWVLNIPFPFAYLASESSPMPLPETFWERVTNLVSLLLSFYFTDYQYQKSTDKIEAILQGEIIPGMPLLTALEKNVSFLLLNSHPAVHAQTPRMPYLAEVGCLQCKKAKPLTKDLEDFMMSSGSHGVIYFSFGSIAKSEQMPEQMRDKFIAAFARLPQKVIWKFTEDRYSKNLTPINEKISDNVRLVDWAPQQDILGHSKVKVFMSHGGGLSMLESVYHGVPLLGIPLFLDQFHNMAHAESRGFALQLDVTSFTVDELVQKLSILVLHKKFKDKTVSISKLMTDYPMRPSETAAYHIEYVIRHQGAPHLKSGAENLHL